MNKPPAFQWYPKDYLASARVAEMTLQEEGAYRRALDYCWINGSVPADAKRLARMIGKGCSKTLAEKVQKMFFLDHEDDSRMIHDRLGEELTKQESWRAKSAEGGRKSAEMRHLQREQKSVGLDLLSRVVEPPFEPKGNTVVCSLQSASSNKDIGQNRNGNAAKPEVASLPTQRKKNLTDEEFIRELKADPTYTGINVEIEAGKMRRWCQENQKEPTRRRFINWLGRADRTMNIQKLKLHNGFKGIEASL